MDLQTQRDIAVPVFIILLKHIRHPLQTDTRLNEQIKTDCILAPPIVRSIEQLHELPGEAVSEGYKGFAEFRVGYCARTIDVEAVEEASPRGEETPQSAMTNLLAGSLTRVRG